MTLTESIVLSYHSEHDILTARWLFDSSLPTMQAEYAAVLAAGQQYGATRWLLDVRCRDTPTPEATHWVMQQWLPYAVVGMEPARLRIAYHVSPARARLVRTDAVLQPLVREALSRIHSYEMCLFVDEEEALHWLRA